MQLLALNASPRGRKSNSSIIRGWLLEGWEAKKGGDIASLDLTQGLEKALEAFKQAETILVVFPLYTDFVPGILKDLFDSLALLPRESLAGKTLACVVHSGFPESAQSEGAAAWLERAAGRLGLGFAGCLIKGGSEGFQMMPPQMTARVAALFKAGGEGLATTGHFPEEVRARLASPRKLSPAGRLAFRILSLGGLTNFYWNGQLRKYGGYKNRFAAPYGPQA